MPENTKHDPGQRELAEHHREAVYVFRLDRFCRSGIRDTFEVVEDLRAYGVQVISISDGFALDGPAAEIVIAVLAWAAKMERLAINERISAARERAEAEGRSWGRPSRLTLADRQRAQALRREGRSVRQIAVSMKVPRSTIARALGRSTQQATS